MDRRNRTVIVLAVAVVMAAVASFGVYLTIKRMPVRQVEVASNFAVVAARALPTGAKLTANDVRLVPWPAKSPVPGSFTKIEDVVNRGLLASTLENEPLVESKLAPAEAGAGLPPSIPHGMRAMSVRVNDVIGVAGFIDSGTRVDVVVTIRKKDESQSRTVVSNVQVLTAGTKADQQKVKDPKAKDTRGPSNAAVVTLLVSPTDAERVALAQAEGTIMLILRNPLDNEPTATTGVKTAALFGGPTPEDRAPVARAVRKAAPAPAVAAPPPPAPSKMYMVEAIRAAKRTEEVVR